MLSFPVIRRLSVLVCSKVVTGPVAAVDQNPSFVFLGLAKLLHAN